MKSQRKRPPRPRAYVRSRANGRSESRRRRISSASAWRSIPQSPVHAAADRGFPSWAKTSPRRWKPAAGAVPCNAARPQRSSSARDDPSSTSMECIGRSTARASVSNARASSFRPRRWPTRSVMERPRSCHARHPKSRRPARMATFLGIGPRDHYLHRG